jgi:hypothetical protein
VDGVCSVCGGVVKARGLCNRHYTRQRKHGDVQTVLTPRRDEIDADELALRRIVDELGTTDRYVVAWMAAVVVAWPRRM